MTKHGAMFVAALLLITPLSLGLKVATITIPESNETFLSTRIDSLFRNAGFAAVGWHALANADVYMARVYRHQGIESTCQGEIFVTLIPRNAEGSVFLKNLTQGNIGEMLYVLDGEAFSEYPLRQVYWSRLHSSIGRMFGVVSITPSYAIASTHPCAALHQMTWSVL